MNNYKNNINAVYERIHKALERAGREPDDITLIAVTKNIDIDVIKEAVSYGIADLGENRVQELLSKYNKVQDVRWHMIGRLQSNKVKHIVDKVALIHSLDRLSLAREINKRAERIQRVVPVLVQVNPAGENKSWSSYEEVIPFIETIFNLKYIKIMGLMFIAPLTDNPEAVRPYFAMMKHLFDVLKDYNYPHVDMKYLSMGMTNDFEIAIEEGSNMVRIGTALFGSRERRKNKVAGKFMNKFLNFIGLEENVTDESMDEVDMADADSRKDDLIEPVFQTKNKRGKVVNIHQSTYVKVVVYQALTYDDTQAIVDNLKNRKPIIVNLDSLEQDLAQRVLDFMSGAVYALDGTIQKVSRSIFVLVPSNIDIVGNIPEDFKGKSFYTLGTRTDKE